MQFRMRAHSSPAWCIKFCSGVQRPRRLSRCSFRYPGKEQRLRQCTSCGKIRAGAYSGEASSSSSTGSTGPTIVWFKNDLRVNDHPGLEDALTSGQGIIPFYCLDRVLVKNVLGFPGGVQLLHGALVNLKRSLRERGSDLVVRIGDLAPAVLECVAVTGAVKVSTEDEVDFRLREAIEQVEASRAASVSRWRASIWEPHEYSENYRTFKASRGEHVGPIKLPSDLPAIDSRFDEWNVEIDGGFLSLLLQYETELGAVECKYSVGMMSPLPWSEWMESLTHEPNSAAGCLKQYLAYRNPNEARSTNGSSTPLGTFITSIEESSVPGLSFPALFFPALSIGLLSPREAYTEAVSALKEKSQGILSSLPGMGQNLVLPKRVACECDVVDFHYHLATGTNGDQLMFWKWKGIAVEFTVSLPENANDDSPAVLLVHGFGASSFHWRRNVDSLKKAGNRVYCITVPGFGRTQKPSLLYSQYVWTDCIVDFIRDVIGKPVCLVGNSIGGYTAASVAGNHNELVRGLVLLNSAGPVVPDYEPNSDAVSDQPSRSVPKLLVDFAAEALLYYLEKTAQGTLKRLYPVNPNNADEELLEEILRAGCDPNADSVLKSVFFLKSPTPLNYLVSDGFGGPTLVLQGCLDPLGDAEGKAKLLQSVCDNLHVEFLKAGHCPHDEIPDDVNEKIVCFIKEIEEKATVGQSATRESPGPFHCVKQ